MSFSVLRMCSVSLVIVKEEKGFLNIGKEGKLKSCFFFSFSMARVLFDMKCECGVVSIPALSNVLYLYLHLKASQG